VVKILLISTFKVKNNVKKASKNKDFRIKKHLWNITKDLAVMFLKNEELKKE